MKIGPRFRVKYQRTDGGTEMAVGQDKQRDRRGALLPAPLPAPLSHVAITARHVSYATSVNFTSPLKSTANDPRPGRAPVTHDRVPSLTQITVEYSAKEGTEREVHSPVLS